MASRLAESALCLAFNPRTIASPPHINFNTFSLSSLPSFPLPLPFTTAFLPLKQLNSNHGFWSAGMRCRHRYWVRFSSLQDSAALHHPRPHRARRESSCGVFNLCSEFFGCNFSSFLLFPLCVVLFPFVCCTLYVATGFAGCN